jgi:predicted RNA-binding protein
MAGSKRKTTMAKLNRERKLLEKRAAKQAKKDARKKARAEGGPEVASEEVERLSGELPV